MKKIVTIIGARPQFIKMALVSKALKANGIKEVVIHTGQHYDKNLSAIFFKELGIARPDYNLGVGSGPYREQVTGMLTGIEKVLAREKPAIVLVYGDTNSTVAGAFAASKGGFAIAHVEAGLRSFNRNMAEEVNRIITDALADILFCPTRTAVDNLEKEGRSDGVYLVGDVMYDSIKWNMDRIKHAPGRSQYILCTIHRAENADSAENLHEIFKALGSIKKKVILPLHPRTAGALKKYGIKAGSNIGIIKPVSYMKMLDLEQHANVIITDSGGVQKEAFIFGIPCVTIRGQTEWVESVRSRMNIVVEAKSGKIVSAVRKMERRRKKVDPEVYYGNGYAHRKIADILEKELAESK
ncbi:MAG: UDP-N-acetylglucosamine 2-epimerase (non-hydrolyzing) [Candidatus Omnitrophica bacterium]|nr:UDP-N-acetylglucosamine 2-epimerase (non-hydrolyzing) [Candidatus Omnitrophota bacterium]MDD5435924.1 UDP-N-acetylglucosamine 2-epimerase (non-hydrolyzing) [Candidatus Omnitrophota bacterium]